jgi:hypothetical protein
MSARLSLILCLLAWLTYLGLSRYFAEHDLVATLLVQKSSGIGFLAAALLGLRLFLILLVPGWLLWLVVRSVEGAWRSGKLWRPRE